MYTARSSTPSTRVCRVKRSPSVRERLYVMVCAATTAYQPRRADSCQKPDPCNRWYRPRSISVRYRPLLTCINVSRSVGRTRKGVRASVHSEGRGPGRRAVSRRRRPSRKSRRYRFTDRSHQCRLCLRSRWRNRTSASGVECNTVQRNLQPPVGLVQASGPPPAPLMPGCADFAWPSMTACAADASDIARAADARVDGFQVRQGPAAAHVLHLEHDEQGGDDHHDPDDDPDHGHDVPLPSRTLSVPSA